MKILLYLWQLPQNLIGLLVILITNAKKTDAEFEYVANDFTPFGVSLGNYIIFGGTVRNENSYKHEYGHHRQSLYLGWLYLFIVGIPSLIGNIWDRIAHKKWTVKKRINWYYSRFPENWADNLGGVVR